MNLNDIPLFRMMGQRMEWLSQRQQLLAHNVANANTPGYKAQDLNPLTFETMVRAGAGRMAARATRSGHLSGGTAGSTTKFKLKAETDSRQKSMTGNDVVVEQEMMKVAQTSMDYQLTTNLYRKHLALIRAALNPPR
ncbi:MAG: flagellar basal body rod protein FlgB [Proteobacteria bacterium]|nr:flagellar basal body rod protein FlgB [Pseudomonadota bacterium]MDA1355394.1 flagellar basal body rod protein FlgB [Pseudomonadota bacterium]